MSHFFRTSPEVFCRWLVSQNEPEYRQKQINEWIYTRSARSWQEMSSLSSALRNRLDAEWKLYTGSLDSHQLNDAKTALKCIFRAYDTRTFSTTLTRTRKKGEWTLSLATQMGCPVGCPFCASGTKFVRNLQVDELLLQYVESQRLLSELGLGKIAEIDCAGMGEPFKNLTALNETLMLLCHREGFGHPPKQLTLNTVGVTPGIEAFTAGTRSYPLRIGLHAPDSKLRSRLVPYAKKHPLEEMIAAVREYGARHRAPIGFDYVLIEGVNDHPDQALALSHLIKPTGASLRLIPCHPTARKNWCASPHKAIKAFRTVLYGNQIPHQLFDDPALLVQAGLGQISPT